MKFTNIFNKAKDLGIEELELSLSSSNTLSFSIYHGKVEKYSVADNKTLYARGIVNGKMGVATTENLNDVDSLLHDVLSNAKYIEDTKEVGIFAGSLKYAKALKYEDKFASIPTSEKIALAIEAEKLAFSLDSRIVEVEEVGYEEARSEQVFANTKGLKKSRKNIEGILYINVVAKENGDVKTGLGYQLVDDYSKIDINKIVKDAVCDATLKLNGTPCASKKYKTILSPKAFASLISIFMSSVNGDNVNKGKSMLKDKLNEVVASNKLTLTEDPLNKELSFLYRNFDDEGVATYKKNIIEKGILKTYLYDIEAAKRAKVEPTGNGYRTSNGIRISTGLLEVKPGKNSLEEVMQKANNGIYINELIGLHAGINALSGDFSLQSNGYLFENGKRTQTVNLITTAGNLFDLLKDIVAIANDSKYTLSGIKSPSVLVKSLSISGK